MLVKINSVGRFGLDLVPVTVEVSITQYGLPTFEIIGLPNKTIGESKQRVRTALANCGLEFPRHKVIINLSPANFPKDGTFYDLPIAVAIICYIYKISALDDTVFYGELSLDGKLVPTRGVYSVGLFAKDHGYKRVISCSSFNTAEIGETRIICLESLHDFIKVFNDGAGKGRLNLLDNFNPHISAASGVSKRVIIGLAPGESTSSTTDNLDFSEIVGQDYAKRALEISAAGGHNIMLIGPPGCGKTQLGYSYKSILPPLTPVELSEACRILSLFGDLDLQPVDMHKTVLRPFCSPHHTISLVGMLGGGANPRPGQITLANNGVLFMDEFAEFDTRVVEALRQPMEVGYLDIVRGGHSFRFPSKFTLLATCNPCPCGFYGDMEKPCKCTPSQIASYKQKLSGPIMDRIDMVVKVTSANRGHLVNSANGVGVQDSSIVISGRVGQGRLIQTKRFTGTNICTNSQMNKEHLSKYCALSKDSTALLEQASLRMCLSGREIHKVIKVSRTIADLAGSTHILCAHILEALSFKIHI